MATLAQIRTAIDNISGEYDARFGGQSRVTRDLNDLNGLVQRLRDQLAALEKLPTSRDRAEVEKTAREALTLYENERKEIMKARSLGPDFIDFDVLRTEANFVFAMYHRHFAGKARNTRDLGLLGEMVDDLERIEESMQELIPRLSGAQGVGDDLETVRSNLAMYRAERGEIIEARGMGDADQQASTLAEVANGQFRIYDQQFAGKSRLSRRPALLQRVIDALSQVLDRMRALESQGLRTEYHTRNIGIVTQSLAQYRTELVEVRKARENTKLVDLQGQLGGAANDVMEQYRQNFAGHDRKTRDLDMLSSICDQLAEVGRQMSDLGTVEPTEQNSRNLQIVTDHRVMLEREYNLIEESKGARQG